MYSMWIRQIVKTLGVLTEILAFIYVYEVLHYRNGRAGKVCVCNVKDFCLIGFFKMIFYKWQSYMAIELFDTNLPSIYREVFQQSWLIQVIQVAQGLYNMPCHTFIQYGLPNGFTPPQISRHL